MLTRSLTQGIFHALEGNKPEFSIVNEHKVLIIGLPDSGKTSFIHAVDDLLQDPPSPEALRAYGLASERDYLERDKEKFRAGIKLERTERNLEGSPPELLFEDPKTDQRGRLFVPDLSGEVFRDQWANREWEESYRDSLNGIAGAMLFVRADKPASNTEIVGAMVKLLSEGGSTQPWDPGKQVSRCSWLTYYNFYLEASIRMHVPCTYRS